MCLSISTVQKKNRRSGLSCRERQKGLSLCKYRWLDRQRPQTRERSTWPPLSACLAGFDSVLQVEGYGGYRAFAEHKYVQLTFC